MPTLTVPLAEGPPQLRWWVAPVVERTTATLMRGSATGDAAGPVLRTPLTEVNRMAGRGGLRTRPAAPERPTVLLVFNACRTCGVILEDRDRRHCDGCLPEVKTRIGEEIRGPALAAASRSVSGGADLRLVTTALPTGTLAPGAELPVTMFLTGDVVGEERVPLWLTLLDANGLERSSGGYGFLRTDEDGAVFSIRRDLKVPSYLPTGTYQVVARFGGPEDETTLVLGQVEVVRSPP